MGQLSLSAAGWICLRTLIIYAFLVVGVRFIGKREIGQTTPLDLVVLILIANAVQNAMTGPDNSLLGGLVSGATLLTANFAASRLTARVPAVRRLLDGKPVVLVAHGQLVTDLAREGITEDELMSALRQNDVERIEDVARATLEVDGEISVLRRRP